MTRSRFAYRSHTFLAGRDDVHKTVVAAHVHDVDVSSITSLYESFEITVVGEKDKAESFVEHYLGRHINRPWPGIEFVE